MPEWVGTVWFLMAIMWSAIRLQQIVIWMFAGVVAWMYQ